MGAKGVFTPSQQYGDTQKLADVKRASGTSGPLVQRTPAGRPAAGQMVPITPVVNQPAQAEVPPEQLSVIENYARAQSTAAKWAQLAQAEDAGPWVRFYAGIAQQHVAQAAAELKRSTPDFISS